MDDLPDTVSHDGAGRGALDAIHAPRNGGGDLTVLKGKVTPLGGAVDQGQALAITKRLGAHKVATDQSQILRIPAKVLALDGTVRHGDPLGVPEGSLRTGKSIFP